MPEQLNGDRYRAHEGFYGPSGFDAPDGVEVFTLNQSGLSRSVVEWNILSRGIHRGKGYKIPRYLVLQPTKFPFGGCIKSGSG